MKVKCANCKEFIDKSDAIPRGISNFCSTACLFAKANKSKELKRTKPPTKVKDIQVNRRLVSDELTDEVRQHVLEFDGFKCRLCGRSSSNLVFHHVIYKSDVRNKRWQDQISNGITLCNRPCHLSVVHGNKKRFQPLCLGIIWLREVERDRHTTIYDLEKRLQNV
jgi:hypothetical protein